MKGILIAALVVIGANSAFAENTQSLEEQIDYINWNPLATGFKGPKKITGWIDVKGRRYRFNFVTEGGKIPPEKTCSPMQGEDNTDCVLAAKVAFANRCIQYKEEMYCDAFNRLSLP